MTVTMSLATLTARLSDVEAPEGMFTAVGLCDTPEAGASEVLFFVDPQTASNALSISDAIREAALRHLPAQKVEEEVSVAVG